MSTHWKLRALTALCPTIWNCYDSARPQLTDTIFEIEPASEMEAT